MEGITITHEDELFIWVLKADLACIMYFQSQADTAAEADDLWVISKEALGNSPGHFKCYSGSQISSESPREKFATEK